MLYRHSRRICGGLLIAATTSTLSAQGYFVSLGTGDISQARDISANGLVVSGNSGPIGDKTLRWTLADGASLLAPGQYSDTDGGINGTGSVIAGGFFGNGTRYVFRWTQETGATSLGDLEGGRFRSIATSVSAHANHEVIVGVGSSERSDWEAFRWTEETGMVGLGDLPGGDFISSAQDVSADGMVIVGGSSSDNGHEAFRWTEETGMVGLGALSDEYFDSIANTVSADGSVVIGISNHQGPRPFRWTEQTGMVELNFPDGGTYRIFDASWDGNVIVGEALLQDGRAGAFYWSAGDGFNMLTDVLAENGVTGYENWHLDRATGVSADGRTIVGSGINPDGQTEGWVAYLGPICRADYDKNDIVDADDVAAYLDRWIAKSIFADWDYDGDINTIDLLAFFNEWASGCE